MYTIHLWRIMALPLLVLKLRYSIIVLRNRNLLVMNTRQSGKKTTVPTLLILSHTGDLHINHLFLGALGLDIT